jgi:threonine dehydrogenase-like Zn-dependent dehydrogenase
MRALVYSDKLHLQTDFATPIAQPHQALIKISKAGICNTDLELTHGYMGFQGVLGHEFVGVVVQGDQHLLNKRVVGEINVAEGDCDMCRRGIPSQCRYRTTVGIFQHQGAFADYLALTTDNLFVVPDNVSDTEAVFVEPLAAACQILEAVHISPRDKVVVVGAGKLGLLCAQVLRLTGADVCVVVRREKPLKMLKKWGLRAVSRADLQDNQADIVVDCTGTAEGFADGLTLVKPRGTIVLKSTYTDIPSANLTKVVIDEVRVIGSRCGPFDAALRLLEAKLVDVNSMVDAHYPFNEAMQAFDKAFLPGALKVIIDF